MKKLVSLVLVLLLIAAIPAFAEGGDVNGDGKVNIRDVGLYQQYLNGWDIEFK